MATRKRRSFTREFKFEAVKRSGEPDRSAASVARELGITLNMMYRWRKEVQALSEQAFPGMGRPIDPTANDELKRLRKQNIELRMERDILKKTLVFFAKDTPSGSDSSKNTDEGSQ